MRHQIPALASKAMSAIWQLARTSPPLQTLAAGLIGTASIAIALLSVVAPAPYNGESRIEAVSEYFQGDAEKVVPQPLSVAAQNAGSQRSPIETQAPGGQAMYVDGLGEPLPLWRERDHALRVVGSYPTGTRVTRLEQKGKWSRVITPDAEWGWMETRYLSPDPPLVAGD
jgi:hypothetical protein